MSALPSPERRQRRRFGANARVEYVVERRRNISFMANLSLGGMHLRSATNLKPGDVMPFRLFLDAPGGPTEVMGEVLPWDGASKRSEAHVAFLQNQPDAFRSLCLYTEETVLPKLRRNLSRAAKAENFLELATLYQDLGMTGEALQVLREGIEAQPDNVVLYEHLAPALFCRISADDEKSLEELKMLRSVLDAAPAESTVLAALTEEVMALEANAETKRKALEREAYEAQFASEVETEARSLAQNYIDDLQAQLESLEHEKSEVDALLSQVQTEFEERNATLGTLQKRLAEVEPTVLLLQERSREADDLAQNLQQQKSMLESEVEALTAEQQRLKLGYAAEREQAEASLAASVARGTALEEALQEQTEAADALEIEILRLRAASSEEHAVLGQRAQELESQLHTTLQEREVFEQTLTALQGTLGGWVGPDFPEAPDPEALREGLTRAVEQLVEQVHEGERRVHRNLCLQDVLRVLEERLREAEERADDAMADHVSALSSFEQEQRRHARALDIAEKARVEAEVAALETREAMAAAQAQMRALHDDNRSLRENAESIQRAWMEDQTAARGREAAREGALRQAEQTVETLCTELAQLRDGWARARADLAASQKNEARAAAQCQSLHNQTRDLQEELTCLRTANQEEQSALQAELENTQEELRQAQQQHAMTDAGLAAARDEALRTQTLIEDLRQKLEFQVRTTQTLRAQMEAASIAAAEHLAEEAACVAAAKTDAEEVRGTLMAHRALLEQTSADLEEQQHRAAHAESRLVSLQEVLSQARAELDSQRERARLAEDALEATARELKVRKGEVERAEGAFAASESRLKHERGEHAQAQARLRAQQAHLEELQAARENDARNVMARVAELEQEATRGAAQAMHMSEVLQARDAELEDLRRQVVEKEEASGREIRCLGAELGAAGEQLKAMEIDRDWHAQARQEVERELAQAHAKAAADAAEQTRQDGLRRLQVAQVAEFAWRERGLQSAAQQLVDERAALTRTRAETEELSSLLSKQLNEVENNRLKIQQCGHVLAERHQTLVQLEKALEDRKVDLKNQTEIIDAQKTAFHEQAVRVEEELKHRCEVIAAQQSALDEKTKQFELEVKRCNASMKTQQASLDQQAAQFETGLRSRVEAMRTQQATLEQQAAQLEADRAMLDALREEVEHAAAIVGKSIGHPPPNATLAERAAQLEADRATLEALRDEVEQSAASLGANTSDERVDTAALDARASTLAEWEAWLAKPENLASLSATERDHVVRQIEAERRELRALRDSRETHPGVTAPS